MVEVSIRVYRPSDLPRCRSLLKFGYDALRFPAYKGALTSRLSTILYTLTILIAYLSPSDFAFYPLFIPLFYWIVLYFYVSRCFDGWEIHVFNGDMKDPANSFQGNHKNSNFWVAELIGSGAAPEVIGCIGFHGQDDAGEMTRLSVDHRFRRLKIATKLVDTVLDWAQQRGIDRVELETTGYQQPAIRLYERYGFRIEEVKDYDWGRIGLKVLKLGMNRKD
jgi:ribosomal protein S18 acetylase RimI-like enzyme